MSSPFDQLMDVSKTDPLTNTRTPHRSEPGFHLCRRPLLPVLVWEDHRKQREAPPTPLLFLLLFSVGFSCCEDDGAESVRRSDVQERLSNPVLIATRSQLHIWRRGVGGGEMKSGGGKMKGFGCRTFLLRKRLQRRSNPSCVHTFKQLLG